ncbi:MAG: hypothetical protein ABIV93_29725 [Byssovorax sp.]
MSTSKASAPPAPPARPAPPAETPLASAFELEGPPSPHEETRMLDLRDLVRLSRERLATTRSQEEQEPPLSVREASLLVDSLAAPAALDPPKVEVEASEPIEEIRPIEASRSVEAASPGPARRRLRSVYSGLALLIVMVGMIAFRAKMAREEASTATLAPEQPELAAQLSSTQEQPAADIPTAAPVPSARPSATAAPTATPRRPPVMRPALPRPRAPAPADTAESRAAAAPETTPHVDLLDAMQAAVSRSSAPASAPKVDCPPTPGGGSGAPSPCARAAPRTSPLRP